MLVFFPSFHDGAQVVLNSCLEKIMDPGLGQGVLVPFFTRLVDGVLSMLRVVRLLSTMKSFPDDLLFSSHAFVEMRTR